MKSQARDLESRLKLALARGTREHYVDPLLYDHEYRRRREDVRFYREIASHYGGPILELGCGSGRLLVRLVKDRHEVVGIDQSRPMLNRLRERLENAGQAARGRATLIEADFRHFRLGRRFPLIVCPFNAFMHLYTRSDVEEALACIRSHLAPGGRFVFDVMHPDLHWLSRDPNRRWARTRFRHPKTGAPMIYSTSLTYDSALQIAFMRIFYEKVGSRRPAAVVHLTHRYFFPLELEALLHYNGFSIEKHDGDFAGNALEPDSDEQVLTCRRRA